MSKMFKCENGTVFPINEVLSVKEATYYDYAGVRVPYPKVFTDAEKLKSEYARKMVSREDCEEGFIAKSIRRLFVRLTKGEKALQESDERAKKEEQRSYEKELEFWSWDAPTSPIGHVSEGMVMKQWDVKIRHRRDAIRISHADYERLCAEMGK